MERITRTLGVFFTLFLSCQVYGQTPTYYPEFDSAPTIDGNLKGQIWLGQSSDTTIHSDDLQMVRGGRYSLGLSRYKIAGIGSNLKLDFPQFSSGEVSSVVRMVLPPPMATSK